MGVTPSNLSAQSQPGSALQNCLHSAFPDASALTFPQAMDYMAKVHPYNLNYDIYPAAVVRPASTAEVSAAVKCAAQAGVKVQARGGGHSFANYCLGGTSGALVVDLVKMQNFEMDKTTWKAKIGAGTLLGDVTKRLHDNGGRAIAHGTCPQVGIGGHATIGGLGPLSRQWGSALDHVQEVEIVLANGTVTRANANTQQDVFFAVKGAAASFGVVTEFVVQTHPEPGSAVHYSYTYTVGADMATTFSKWQQLIATPNLDRKFASQVTITPVGMIVSGTYFGTKAEFDAIGMQEKIGHGALVKIDVLDDFIGSVENWAENEALQLFGGIPAAFYSKSLAFKNTTLIPETGIKSLFDYLNKANKGTLLWVVIFDLEGGATNDPPQDSSAYAHRDALFYIQTYAIGIGKISDTTRKFLDGINSNIQASMPGTNFGAYAGYVDPFLKDGQQQYWGSNYPKLQAIKKTIDPQDVFSNPQSVKLP